MSASKVSQVEVNGNPFWRIGDELYPDYLNHGNAGAFIRHVAEKWCRGHGLDIGAGQWPFPGAKPIDLGKENAYQLDSIPDNSQDYVYSSHCLEHLERPREALKLWVRKLRSGGHIFLYLPHPAMTLWHPGGAWAGEGHKWIPETHALDVMLYDAGAITLGMSEWPDAYWSFYIYGKKA